MDLSRATEWRAFIFSEMYRLMHNFEADNFDRWRFHDFPSNVFFAENHAAYLGVIAAHHEELYRTREMLSDEDSRQLFDRLVLFRLLGHNHVRLPLSNPEAAAKAAIPHDWIVSETQDGSAYGKLCVLSVPVGNEVVWVKCWPGNVSAHLWRQYYFERDGIRIQPEPGESVIDAGGCFGDTAAFFAQSVGQSGRVYTFDPLSKHCEIIREMCLLNGQMGERISLIEAGVSDVNERGTLSSDDAGINPGARVGQGSGLALRTIDSLVAEGTIPRVDFIKMDIEGSELPALKGGEQAIRRWRPKLAISLYHRLEDFFAIPHWIASLGLGYRFYLDHYSIHAEETVLYAMVPEALLP